MHRRARRRERDDRICVLKQTFDQSADCCQSYVAAAYPSVPVAGPRIQFRVFTRRGNQGLVRARGYPRKPRVKYIAIRIVNNLMWHVSNLTLARHPSSRPLKGRGWVRSRSRRVRWKEGTTAGLFVGWRSITRVSIWNGQRALRGRVRACAFCGKCRRWRWHSMIDDDGGGLYGGQACVRVRVRKRVCILLIGGCLGYTCACERACVRALLCAHGSV